MQNVSLGLGIFCETTVVTSKLCCGARNDMHGFLTLVHTWWTIVNAKVRFAPNPLGNALDKNDEKLRFLLTFVNWLSLWCESRSTFCLSKQTFDGMIKTLRAQAHLASDLLHESYQYVLPAKF